MSGTGSPPALVLLHGFAGRPEVWAPLLPLLPKDCRVFAPAILGHSPAILPGVGNDSTADSQRGFEGFETEVDRLAGEIRKHGLEGAHVAGYSLGGRLALGLLVRHGRLFSGATLLGTHPGLTSESERRQRLAADEVWARRLENDDLDAFFDTWEAQPIFSTQSPAQREKQRALRRGLDAHGLARAMRRLGLGCMPDYSRSLGDLRLPVSWVAGELDEKFRSLAAVCAAATPSGITKTIEGAGHNVVLERPEDVASILSSNLTQTPIPLNALEGLSI
ncbi:MAG: alpha/beta fold hydrolase [Acidobacteria bacterium]|nr:alpha/beta fold hydrolase [Acidobacteriota bacterium]